MLAIVSRNGLWLGILAAVALAAAPVAAARTHTHLCGKVYDFPPNARVLAFRDVRADGVGCRVAGGVLIHFISGPMRFTFYPPHSRHPKSETDFGTTRGGWHCVQHFAYLGPPRGHGATRCTKGTKVLTGTYIP